MKGAINTGVAFVIGAVILAISASGITSTFNLADAFDPLGYKERQAKTEDANNALQEAITCAYYRCLEGCNSNKISESCRQSFCDIKNKDHLKFMDEDDRICGKDAMAFPVYPLQFVKFGTLKSGDSMNLDNSKSDKIDVCVRYEPPKDVCRDREYATKFEGTIDYIEFEIEDDPKPANTDHAILEKIDKGNPGDCKALVRIAEKASVKVDRFYLWGVKDRVSIVGFTLDRPIATSLKACGYPAYQCTKTPLECSARSGKDKCEDNDSGCKWDKSTSTCKPGKVGQGEGPRPCQLFTDEKKCSANNCQWNPKIS